MCVVAIAWQAHPRWRLLVAGNRDEFHARASAPLARWNDGSGIIAGRDLVSGGTWMGVSDSGRFAVVTNIRNAQGPDETKLSRGALVTDWLANARLPDDGDLFNPFNLIAIGTESVNYVANRPSVSRQLLAAGIHGLSNAIRDEHWPRMEQLTDEMAKWLERSGDEPEQLLDLLGYERAAHPLFIRSQVYGTRCSTIVSVDMEGNGQIIERRFDADGIGTGQKSLHFLWSPQEA